VPAPSDVLNAGRIGRPHGLDGSFYVTRPRAPLLALGGSLRVGSTWRAIARRSGTDEHPILRLEGVADRPAIEALRGEDLFVARADAPTLEPDEYWAEDLQGCQVVSVYGRSLGVVEGLRALPSCEVLEVGELLVPMVGDAVRSVDVASRRIVVDAQFLGLEEPSGPVAGDPRPASDRPTADRPTADRPTADRPTADRPTADPPTADPPTVDQPSADRRAGQAARG
jgi:16S rRNA processing protein RimM